MIFNILLFVYMYYQKLKCILQSRVVHSMLLAALAGTLFLKARLAADASLERGQLYLGLLFFSLMHVRPFFLETAA